MSPYQQRIVSLSKLQNIIYNFIRENTKDGTWISQLDVIFFRGKDDKRTRTTLQQLLSFKVIKTCMIEVHTSSGLRIRRYYQIIKHK